ncbi:MAG: hypothetical protein MUC77_08045 [Chromatiaceae bacterium]|jgi:hypothetical protein|nr:hypothetical protein [Chromatiaceae bacterium]
MNKSGMPPSTLWSDEHRKRLFLIPEGIELPIGELRLRTSGGRDRWVQPSTVAPYQVSADVACAWAQAELSSVSRQLGGNPRRSFPSVPAPEQPGNASADAPATPGLDLLAAITGTPRADLDTGALGAALKRYFGDIGGTIADAVSGEPARIARAKVRMAEWSAILRAHGTEVGEAAPAGTPSGRVPTSEPGAPEPAAGGTATESDSGRPVGEVGGLAERLHALAEDFRRRADALAAARETRPGAAATPETRCADKSSASGVGQPAAAVRLDRAATEAQATGEPSEASGTTGSADGPAATGQPESPSHGYTQAAALEALAEGLEDAATDAAARLRAYAETLRDRS